MKEPGIFFKKPLIQDVAYLPRRVQRWDGDPDRMPTRDKKNIYIDVYARWRIIRPANFFVRARTVTRGQKLLDDFIDGAVRDAVGSNTLIELVRSDNRQLIYETQELTDEYAKIAQTIDAGRRVIEGNILATINNRIQGQEAGDIGIEIIDVRIKRINYVPSVRESVYERMKAERRRIAARYISEGREESDKILGDMQKELDVIQGDGTRRSTEVRGRADAEVIAIYGDAINTAQDFYSLQRNLRALESALSSETELILTSEMPFMKMLEMDLAELDGK